MECQLQFSIAPMRRGWQSSSSYHKPDTAGHARLMHTLLLQIEDAAVRAAKAGPKEIGDVDTDDDLDEAAEQQEYELWKSREMARIRC